MGAFDPQELSLFRESVDRFAIDSFDLDRLREAMAHGRCDEDTWRTLAALGWLALPLPSQYGGMDGGSAETAIVMQAIGRNLMLEPYLATILLGGALIARAGTEQQRGEILPAVGGGDVKLAFAFQEADSGYGLAVPTVRCAGGRLTGGKVAILHGDVADRLVVLATDEQARARLYLTAPGRAGMTLVRHATIDGRSVADVTFAAAAAEPMADVDTLPIVEAVLCGAIVATCAEAVGAIAALNQLVLDYVKQRKQFGVAIGSFQVLQHRLVDMAIAEQEASAITAMAAAALDAGSAEASLLCSAAKARVGAAARFVGEAAIQTHGGIGMVDEYVAGHLFKRLLMLEAQFGSASWHLGRIADGLD